jgi:hypothetical protein
MAQVDWKNCYGGTMGLQNFHELKRTRIAMIATLAVAAAASATNLPFFVTTEASGGVG